MSHNSLRILIEYPCKEPYHEFQITDYRKGICECLYCPCSTSVEIMKLYHKWKKEAKKR